MTAKAFPRRERARVVATNMPLGESEGAGKAGCAMHPQPRVRMIIKHTSQSPQVHRNIPAFPAQWFTAYTALSPVIGLVCHRRLRVAPQT